MRNECNIIRDILPLYVEDMVGPDTISYVEEHFENCEACRNEYERMKEQTGTQAAEQAGTGANVRAGTQAAKPRGGRSGKEPDLRSGRRDAAPLLALKKKMRAKEIRTIALTAVFVIVIFVSVIAVLETPEYFPYSEDLLEVTPLDNGEVLLTFDGSVTDFRLTQYVGRPNQKQDYYEVEAWSSPLSRWLSGRWFSSQGELSTRIYPTGELPIAVAYSPNDGEENICVYGELGDFSGVISLPRLNLGYYLLFAVIAFGGTLAVWFFVRKRAKARAWVERVMLYPVAYVASHLVIVGFAFETYNSWRDFMLIVPISILLYCGMLLAYGVWRIRKEIKELA